MLSRCGGGMGLLALASLLGEQGMLEAAVSAGQRLNPMAPQMLMFRSRAKAVIWMFVNGGPSHVDLWDYKPELVKRDGQELAEFDKHTGFFANAVGPLMKPVFKFRPRGECGTMVSDAFPLLGGHVDKMAFIHSRYTDSNNHSPALFTMNTGVPRMGRPCVGS